LENIDEINETITTITTRALLAMTMNDEAKMVESLCIQSNIVINSAGGIGCNLGML
jgi:hypothetical protein